MTPAPPLQWGASEPTDVVGRRIGAWFIDVAILAVVGFALLVALGGIKTVGAAEARAKYGSSDICRYLQRTNPGTYTDQSSGQGCFGTLQSPGSTSRARVVWVQPSNGENQLVYLDTAGLVVLALIVLLTVVLEGLTGATPGKAMLGLRTLRSRGEVPGVGGGFLRMLGSIVDYILLLPIVGGIVMVSSRRHQRVGDLSAKTFVVDKSWAGRPIPGAGPTVGAPPPGPAAAPPPGPAAAPPPGPAAAPPPGPAAAPPPGPATPPPSPTPVDTDPAPADTPSDPRRPRWDPARGAYIVWDDARGQWLQYDRALSTWRPIG